MLPSRIVPVVIPGTAILFPRGSSPALPISHVGSIRICDDHVPDPEDEEVCAQCGSIFWGMANHVCDVCKLHWQLPTLLYPPSHPAVIAFYYDHGIEFDLASHEQRAYLLDYLEEVVSKDPLRIQTTIPLDGDELRITFDEQMAVVDVNR